MIYKIDQKTHGSLNYNVVTVNEDSPWFYHCWSLVERITESYELPIVYEIDDVKLYEGTLSDLPLTNSDQFLVSKKLLSIISSLNIDFEAYESLIMYGGDVISDNYLTLNLLNSARCLDWSRSVYRDSEDFPNDRVRSIENLVVKEDKLPSFDVFRLYENTNIILVSEEFHSRCVESGISGIDFIKVELS